MFWSKRKQLLLWRAVGNTEDSIHALRREVGRLRAAVSFLSTADERQKASAGGLLLCTVLYRCASNTIVIDSAERQRIIDRVLTPLSLSHEPPMGEFMAISGVDGSLLHVDVRSLGDMTITPHNATASSLRRKPRG